MHVDANIGGSVDGTAGADLEVLASQVTAAERVGFDGVWSTEVSRDPFLPLMIAADRSRTLRLGTAVAVAFARSPMTMATVANDLNTFSRGRFVLGLGSQIQAHIQRRFGMPWSGPAERMREYIEALRAIWQCWYTGEKLDFRGAHYQHTLMTPMFSPQPNQFGPPRVVVAAVGPQMTTVAAEVADGLLVHGFTTARYLREVTMPLIDTGLKASGRTRAEFTTTYPGLVATGEDEKSLVAAIRRVRDQIAFYGATPAYRKVLDLHGWGDLHLELHRLSRRGQWKDMAALVDDDVLHTIAVVGDPTEVGGDIARRFGGLVDRFTLYTPYPLSEATVAALVSAIKAA
ncbi:LLM class F420-dependent oxidoreductase [Mycobacterium vulneris]|jgi:probable F420-dependent oxidoreductase|uniref:LLM class F420-dependent oxidoreductase n=1 Tax=Mycolicibacterium vulneris TaxID=547163 RepID=A0A1X2LEY4_9MYCO|nr:LLM class F420-dependent oxidoreductase [Mycolicibacterium vulneris]OSC32569.1 LLM class F420-dependent oxidoreductase [Mycolicibacterium vulneris]